MRPDPCIRNHETALSWCSYRKVPMAATSDRALLAPATLRHRVEDMRQGRRWRKKRRRWQLGTFHRRFPKLVGHLCGHEVRFQIPRDRAFDGAKNPCAVRIDVRPFKKRHIGGRPDPTGHANIVPFRSCYRDKFRLSIRLRASDSLFARPKIPLAAKSHSRGS